MMGVINLSKSSILCFDGMNVNLYKYLLRLKIAFCAWPERVFCVSEN